MGCDIHVRAERKNEAQAESEYSPIDGSFLNYRHYGLFGFLADVRNYSGIVPLSKPRGLPADLPPDDEFADNSNYHSHSWFSLEELLAVDYDQIIEDRRVSGMNARGFMDGGMTCEPGEGKKKPLREFLGRDYMDALESLKAAGADRIVFAFDC